ncbi:hypothetical protein KEM09_12990 [Carboxylicivirga mesophila]|uniref:Uncharacterized protein n=1 Tax=Carboxylicivirga mesophila TaxID=1166478 RepID=A0ABS5KBD0_9BACT|nr:hypothetical protein [Carboxylicivirga mesophila]MBS2212325.1 hypothetical protein [Carboxylicivirga mesophila]
MTNKQAIFIAILLLAASIVIEVLAATSDISLDIDHIELFAGFLFGIGIAILIRQLLGKNKGKKQRTNPLNL